LEWGHPRTKAFGIAVLVLAIVFAALGPAKWQLRTGLGWRFDHFIGYFAFTLMICLAWPRALLVGGSVIAFATLLEGLQALTPDRTADLQRMLLLMQHFGSQWPSLSSVAMAAAVFLNLRR
jgi:VanZ family protein